MGERGSSEIHLFFRRRLVLDEILLVAQVAAKKAVAAARAIIE